MGMKAGGSVSRKEYHNGFQKEKEREEDGDSLWSWCWYSSRSQWCHQLVCHNLQLLNLCCHACHILIDIAEHS